MPGERWHDLAIAACSRLIGASFARELSEMRKAQWMGPEQLRSRMESKLVSLLKHAAAHVPYYRGVCRRLGLSAGDFRSLEDLRALPVMTKSDYRAQPAEMFFAENAPAHRRMALRTSGSTGEPLEFHIDRDSLPVVFASHLFYDSWYRLRPFDRQVRVMAQPPAPDPLPPHTPALRRLRYALTRNLQAFYESRTQLRFLISDIDADRAREMWRAIEDFQPAYITGYTSTLATLAAELSRQNLRLSCGLKGVVTIAETLTPARRLILQRYFDAPLINRYGQREFKFWAAQCCPAAPELFHMNTELVAWEILREDGETAAPGEPGRLILTNLYSYARPFLRYDTGDIAVAVPSARCACGRGFEAIGEIHGRSVECIQTPTGKVISPAILGHFLFVLKPYLDWIRQYQLVAESSGVVRLLAVPVSAQSPDLAVRLEKDLLELLGSDVKVTIEFVPAIPLEPSGKRPIIRNLAAHTNMPFAPA